MKHFIKRSVKIMGLSFVAGIAFGGLAHLLSVAAKKASYRHPAIIRISDQNRYSSCSAFVVSDRYAITARHCVYDPEKMSFFTFEAPTLLHKIDVVSGDNKTIITTDVIPNGTRMDVIAIKGDFSKFHKLKVQNRTLFMLEEDAYKACGYPLGSAHLVCSNIRIKHNFTERYAGTGYLIFGMSGGPVINTTNDIAIGVASAITDGFMVFTPVLVLEKMLGIPDGEFNE